ncbi:MAG: hypothetical protein WBA43_19765 [Elainellaceae cyanobacterium]
MTLSLARLDVTQIFCDVDDVYRELEQFCERDIARLPCDEVPKGYQSGQVRWRSPLNPTRASIHSGRSAPKTGQCPQKIV